MKFNDLTSGNRSIGLEDFFNELYTLYGNKVFNIAYRMTGDEKISEDITQETFIKVITNLRNFRGDGQIFTWIYAIARNLCLRHLEKSKRSSFSSIERLIEKASVNDGSEQYDEQEKQSYISQVKDGCLLGVLRCLSFNQRLAFILNILFDLPINDVSDIIDKSENATRILIHRARKNIKEFLCNNCSLYDETNKCACGHLISFSLKQGWIEKYHPSVAPEVVETEIKAFKSEIMLYKTISSKTESNDLRERILAVIGEGGLNIFSNQKVK